MNKLSQIVSHYLPHPGRIPNALTLFLVIILSISTPLMAQKGSSSSGGASSSASGKGTGSGNASQNSSGTGQGAGQATGTAYFETQMLAYGAVNQIAETIANEVCKLPTSATVILFDPVSFQNLQMWQSFQAAAALLEDAYKTLLAPQDLPVVTLNGPSFAGAAGFGALSGLVGALAASTTNSASTFTIQDSTMAVSIAHQVKRCQAAPNIIYYPLFGSYVDSDPKKLVTDELEKLNVVRKIAQDKALSGSKGSDSPSVGTGITIRPGSASLLASQTQQFTAATNGGDPVTVTWSVAGTGTIDATGVYTAPASAPSSQTATIRAVSTAPAGNATATVTVGPGVTNTDARFSIVQDLNTQYDQLITSLLNPTGQATGAVTGTAPAGITSLVQGADLEKRLEKVGTYVLYADVVAAGGTQIDRKNALTVLFTGDWISYSGGLVVNVALAETTRNELIFSDTLRYRTAPWLPFATVGHPQNSSRVESTNAGDNESSLCNREKHHRFWQSNTTCGVLSSLTASTPKVKSGSSVSGTVTLNRPAPAGGVNVTLYSSGPISAPTTVAVAEGKTAQSFTINALGVPTESPAQILASLAGITKTVGVTVFPTAP